MLLTCWSNMEHLQFIFAVLCGALVGFILGLIGGGGSIIATPLLLYIVGLPPHMAIGTGALAVSVNAFFNFANHARAGNVQWRSAVLFAVFGVAGAAIGSSLGKAFDGQQLLFLFAVLMMVVGVLVLRRGPHREGGTVRAERLSAAALAKIAISALLVGMLSGFFGIGGGFLIVPGLLFSTGMPIIFAVGSSLLSVGSFGLTTAINYAASGLVDWLVAAEYIAGGILGGLMGMRLCIRLAPRKAALNRVFAGFVFAVAVYMLYRNAGALSAL
jgi:uncharacterized membrane protein YfcA